MNSIFKTNHVYWIGPRESDIAQIKHLFSGSITFFGSGTAEGYSIPDTIDPQKEIVFSGGAANWKEGFSDGEKPEFMDMGKNGYRCGNFCLSRMDSFDHNNMGDVSLDKFIYYMVHVIRKYDDHAKFYMYNPNVMRPHGKGQNDVSDLVREKKYFLPSLSFYDENYLCINDMDTMINLDSKILFRKSLDQHHFGSENLIDIKLCRGKEIQSYYTMCQKFDIDTTSRTRFIVQENFSSGGVGTHILNKPRYGDELPFNPKPDEEYLCSVLQENSISVNAHIILFEDQILLLPPSVQIICENNNCLLYRGGDFASYRSIRGDLRRRFEGLCAKIARLFMHEGVQMKKDGSDKIRRYYGVMGIDAIIHDGKVQILECNNRFQSSSYLLNIALLENGLPSLQELNIAAFDRWTIFDVINEINKTGNEQRIIKVTYDDDEYYSLHLEVNYSNFDFLDSGNNIMHANQFFSLANTYLAEGGENASALYSLERDGYNPKGKYNSYAYLFRATFRDSISAISHDGGLLINENICESERSWSDAVYEYDALITKISLLVQGVRISRDKNTELYLKNHNGFRPATNDAIDLFLRTPAALNAPKYIETIVNAPVYMHGVSDKFTRFTEFSPYELRAFGAENGIADLRLGLFYYDKLINDNISLFPFDSLSDRVTSGGHKYSDIAYLTGDRLRVHTTGHCKYKHFSDNMWQGCHFCNMQCIPNGQKFTEDEIKEVLKAYHENEKTLNIRHYLVGGQSSEDGGISPESVVEFIHEIDPAKNIYVMIVPPSDKKDIIKLVKNGATEFAFNIEVFNDFYAKKYMPGKASAFSRNDYFRTLNQARFIMDDDSVDCVRSMLIVGLEPIGSLKQGLKTLIENGIQPMLSVFRPLRGTELEFYLPPKMKDLYQLYLEVEMECSSHSMTLGPSCHYCQNNTLSMPH